MEAEVRTGLLMNFNATKLKSGIKGLITDFRAGFLADLDQRVACPADLFDRASEYVN